MSEETHGNGNLPPGPDNSISPPGTDNLNPQQGPSRDNWVWYRRPGQDNSIPPPGPDNLNPQPGPHRDDYVWYRRPGPGPDNSIPPPGPDNLNRQPGSGNWNWIRPTGPDYWNRPPGPEYWNRPTGPDYWNWNRAPGPSNWIWNRPPAPGPSNWNWNRHPAPGNWNVGWQTLPPGEVWNSELNQRSGEEAWNSELNQSPGEEAWNAELNLQSGEGTWDPLYGWSWPQAQAAGGWSQFLPQSPPYWHTHPWNQYPVYAGPEPWRGGGIPIPQAVNGSIVTRQMMPVGTSTLRVIQYDSSVSRDGINLDDTNANFSFHLPRTSTTADDSDVVLTLLSDEEPEADENDKSLPSNHDTPSFSSLSDSKTDETASACSDSSSLKSGSCAFPMDQEQIEEGTESESESESEAESEPNYTSVNCELGKGDEKSELELLAVSFVAIIEVEAYNVCEGDEEETVSTFVDEDDEDGIIQVGLHPPVNEEFEFDSSSLFAAKIPEEPLCSIPLVVEDDFLMDIDDDQNTKLAASRSQIQVCVAPPVNEVFYSSPSDTAEITKEREEPVCTIPSVKAESMESDQTRESESTKLTAIQSQIQVDQPPSDNEENGSDSDSSSSDSDTAKLPEDSDSTVKGKFNDDDQNINSEAEAGSNRIQVDQDQPSSSDEDEEYGPSSSSSSNSSTIPIPEESVCPLLPVKGELKDDDENINSEAGSNRIQVNQPSSDEDEEYGPTSSSSSDTSTIPEESVCPLLPVKGEFKDDDQSTKWQASPSPAPGYSKATEARVGARCEVSKPLETNKMDFETTETETAPQALRTLKPELSDETAKPGSSKVTSMDLKGLSKIPLRELQRRMGTLKLSANFKNSVYRAYFNLDKLPSTKKIRCLVIGSDAACNLTISGIMENAKVFEINQFEQMKPAELTTYYDNEHQFRAKIMEENLMYFVYMKDCDEGLDLRRSDFLRHLKMLSRLNIARNVDVMLWRDSKINDRNYPTLEAMDQILIHTGLPLQTFYHDQEDYRKHSLSFLAHRMRKVAQIDFQILQKKMAEVERKDGSSQNKRARCDPAGAEKK